MSEIENKAKLFFAELKNSKDDGSGEVIKTLKTGFKDIRKSLDKSAESTSETMVGNSVNEREKSSKTLKRFTSIDNSLKALIKIESESLKLKKREIDKNRFSVKDNLKQAKVAKSVSDKKTKSGGSLFGLIKTGIAGILAAVKAATGAGGDVLDTITGGGIEGVAGLAAEKGLAKLFASQLVRTAASAFTAALIPTLLVGSIGALIYKSFEHLQDEKVTRFGLQEANEKLMKDPNKTIKSSQYENGIKLVDMSDDAIRTHVRGEAQLGKSQAEKADHVSKRSEEMISIRDKARDKNAATAKTAKVDIAKDLGTVKERTDAMNTTKDSGFNTGSKNATAPNMIIAAAGDDNTPTRADIFKLGKNVSLAGLKEDTLGKFVSLAETYYELTGNPLKVNSGYRDFDHQEMLYRGRKLGKPGFNPAHQPGHSAHNFGTALDIDSAAVQYLKTGTDTNYLELFGLTQPYTKAGEKWHVHDTNYDINEQIKDGASIATVYKGLRERDSGYQALLAESNTLKTFADGGYTNAPSIFGEAGPEFAIPFNNKGVGILAEAMNQAMRITTPMNKANDNSSGKMKEYLNNQFIPKLAKAIMQEGKKNSQNSNGNVQAINAFS
jgi:hypothetical protein|tara:strand:- start:3283 stop:5112 length:1830 start_codon:yes stop_codon:yes gene_type:complete